MGIWKIIGLAGIAGFAGAAGAVVIRRRREWRELGEDELRDHLHARLETARAEGRIA